MRSEVGSSPARRAARRRFTAERTLALSVPETWRVLGDTDHMNRVLRLPAVEFSPPGGAETGFVRRARTRLFGALSIAYREHPFEWVRERGYSELREFDSGPFASLRVGVEIEPAAGASPAARQSPPAELDAARGARVRATVELEPSGLLGRVVAPLAGPRMVAAMLDYCEDALARRSSGGDLSPLPPGGIRVDERRLDLLLERLARAPVLDRLLPRLRERIARGTDAQVLRIRPFELADDWSEDRVEVLRLFLHATRVGLFELRWELMCPACRVPKSEVGGLADLPERFHCDACGIDYKTDFDRRVELRFSVHPALRKAQDAVYCIGGPLRTPHVVLQQRLEPGEERRVRAALGGALQLRAAGGIQAVSLVPAPGADLPPEVLPALELRYGGGTWLGDRGQAADTHSFPPGDVELRLRNETELPLLVQIETAEGDPAAATAAQVTALQEFRDLFSSEVLAPGQEVGVSTVALLFSDLKGSTSLYEGVGDAPAFGRVNRHFDFLREAIARNRGAIVKTIGDAVMGAFSSLEDALHAALEIQRDLTAWCAAQGIDPPFELRVGVHAGPAIAVNANTRLDYFGRTVNLAARVERESVGGDVVVLQELLEEPAGRRALGELDVTAEAFRAPLKGILESARLVRLRPQSKSGREASVPGDATRPIPIAR
jgi:class 3 adenylate cyclase